MHKRAEGVGEALAVLALFDMIAVLEIDKICRLKLHRCLQERLVGLLGHGEARFVIPWNSGNALLTCGSKIGSHATPKETKINTKALKLII